MWADLSITGAYLIRPFGIAFLVAVAGVEILRKRRITPFLIATAATFVPLMLVNNFLFHSDGAYSSQFTFSPSAIVHHAIDYAKYFSYAFANPLSNLYRYALWAATLIPVVFGIVKRVRVGLGLTELYVFTLLAVDSVYWVSNPRYLMPIMPIYLVYMFEGFQAIVERFPQRLALPLKAAAAALLLFAPGANAFLDRPDPKDTLVTAPMYEGLCAAVRQQTERNALLIFWNPRVLAFSTARHASGWPAEGKPEDMMRYLARVHPSYIVVDKNHPDDQQFLIPDLAASPLSATILYENSEFRLLRLKG